MTTVALIAGARPNFVKIAAVLEGLRRAAPEIEPLLIHTGQHYDQELSELFFRQLEIRPPDLSLGVGSAPHGRQTADVLTRYEAYLLEASPRPAATLVVGDVNSTVAAALASVKLGIPAVHVEAGLRSFDRTMPEEINRVVTDAISELLLASEPAGVENLRREGRPEEAIRLVGNVMIDVLDRLLPAARELAESTRLELPPGGFVLWTVHRPSNVDDPDRLHRLASVLEAVADRWPVVLPAHPRTRRRLEDAGLWERLADRPGLHLCPPLGYLEFLSLQADSGLVVTDSGGVQEETTVLGVPCLTLRPNTERPITLEEGTNTLVDDLDDLEGAIAEALETAPKKRGRRPPLWDGRAGERVARELLAFLDGGR